MGCGNTKVEEDGGLKSCREPKPKEKSISSESKTIKNETKVKNKFDGVDEVSVSSVKVKKEEVPSLDSSKTEEKKKKKSKKVENDISVSKGFEEGSVLERIKSYLSSEEWKRPLEEEFVDHHCSLFYNEPILDTIERRNRKIKRSEIHDQFRHLFPSLVENLLSETGITKQQFIETIAEETSLAVNTPVPLSSPVPETFGSPNRFKIIKDEDSKDFFSKQLEQHVGLFEHQKLMKKVSDYILAVDYFPTFNKLMKTRNLELFNKKKSRSLQKHDFEDTSFYGSSLDKEENNNFLHIPKKTPSSTSSLTDPRRTPISPLTPHKMLSPTTTTTTTSLSKDSSDDEVNTELTDEEKKKKKEVFEKFQEEVTEVFADVLTSCRFLELNELKKGIDEAKRIDEYYQQFVNKGLISLKWGVLETTLNDLTETPLMLCLSSQRSGELKDNPEEQVRLELVKFLLNEPLLDVNRSYMHGYEDSGRTAAYLAAKYWHIECLEVILQHPEFDLCVGKDPMEIESLEDCEGVKEILNLHRKKDKMEKKETKEKMIRLESDLEILKELVSEQKKELSKLKEQMSEKN